MPPKRARQVVERAQHRRPGADLTIDRGVVGQHLALVATEKTGNGQDLLGRRLAKTVGHELVAQAGRHACRPTCAVGIETGPAAPLRDQALDLPDVGIRLADRPPLGQREVERPRRPRS